MNARTQIVAPVPATPVPAPRPRAASRAQLRHLARAVQLEEQGDPALARLTIWTISLVILSLVAWACFATTPEVTRSEGRITPLGFERSVQHPAGGAIRRLHFRSGQRVEKGQLLAELDPSAAQGDLDRATARGASLGMEAERLRAFLEDRAPDYEAFGLSLHPEFREAADTLAAMRRALSDRRRIASRLIEQRLQDLEVLRSQRGTQMDMIASLRELMAGREALFAKGLTTIATVTDLRREVTEAEGRLLVIDERISQARTAITEFRARLDSVGSEERSRAFQSLQTVQSAIEDNRAVISKLDGQLHDLLILAPASGVVKGRNDITEGGVLSPGEELMTIVPEDAPLVARVRIQPKDVGRIHIGQAAHVKVSAYDFSRYGAISGRLEYISAGSYEAPDGRVYFDAEVSLDRPYAGDVAGMNLVSSGMTVSVDIINSERTLIAYLFKPVQVALSGAFGEN